MHDSQSKYKNRLYMFEKRSCNTCLVNPTANIKCICKRVFMKNHTQRKYIFVSCLLAMKETHVELYSIHVEPSTFFLVIGLMFSLTNPLLHLLHVKEQRGTETKVSLPAFLITISHLLPKGKHDTKRIKEDSKNSPEEAKETQFVIYLHCVLNQFSNEGKIHENCLFGRTTDRFMDTFEENTVRGCLFLCLCCLIQYVCRICCLSLKSRFSLWFLQEIKKKHQGLCRRLLSSSSF